MRHSRISKELSLPYAHLNLRRNPFGKLTRPEKNQISVIRLDLEPYIKKLQKPGYALQFLKEGARNKTTHILNIRKSFPQAPYIRLAEGQPIPEIPESPVLFLDWFHLMPLEQRWRMLCRHASFGIVSHINHGPEFRGARLDFDLVKLPVYTPEQLKEQVDRRIAWAQRDITKPVPTVSLEVVKSLLAGLGDDVTVIAHLYDVFEELEEVRDVQVFNRNHL